MATQTQGALASPHVSLRVDDEPSVGDRAEMRALLPESSQQVDQNCAYVRERMAFEKLQTGKNVPTFKFSKDPSTQREVKVFDGATGRDLDESQSREVTPLNVQDSSSDISYLRPAQPRSRKKCYCLIIATSVAAVVGAVLLAKSLNYL